MGVEVTNGEAEIDVPALMEERDRLYRAAQHLANYYVTLNDGCAIAVRDGSGTKACGREVVAVRWESGFADEVCAEHVETAKGRGALLVYPKKHDGTEV